MRTVSAAVDAILRGAPKTRVRLSTKDSTGTYRDLTTYAKGENMVVAIEFGEDIDSPGITWSAKVKREQELLSLAPTMQSSGLNRRFNIANAYAPLLQVGRMIKVEFALQAEDDPAALSWSLAFLGYLDEIEWGDDEISLTGRGEEAKLIDTFIQRERVYGYAQGASATKGVYIWEPSRAYEVGDLVIPTDAKRNGHYYKIAASDDGTSGSAEPTWPTGGASTVADGSATWTEAGSTSTSVGTDVETIIQQILDDNGLGIVSLWCPTSPAWAIKCFLVGRQPVMDVLSMLADQIGWGLRYMYDGGSSSKRLKLFDPDRANTTSMRTFGVAEVVKVTSANVRIFDIRNMIRVVFSDAQDLDASGNPKRKSVTVDDSTSRAKYGDRFAEIAESSTSNIDTTSEASDLAAAVLSDLAEPEAEFGAEVIFFPFVELADLYTLAANGVQFDSAQKLAVVGYRHTSEAEKGCTTITLRGKPSTGGAKWLQRMTDSYNGDTHQFVSFENTGTFGITAIDLPVGGARFYTSWGGSKSGHDVSYELHISTASGFTPSASTLVATGNQRNVEVADLNPLTTYYAVLVPITMNGGLPVRGQKSAEVTFTPGALKAAQVSPELTPGPTPLNGGFESWFGGSGVVPDHWSVVTGVWGREVERATTARSGRYSAKFTTNTTTAVKIRTSFFPMPAGVPVTYGAWIQKTGSIEAADNLTIAIEFYDSAKALISTASFTTDINSIAAGWVRLERGTTAPSTTQFAKVYVAKASALDFQVYIDDVTAVFDDQAWHLVGGTGEPSFSNSWVSYGSGFEPRFRREGNRRWLGGMAKNGSSATASVFTLATQDRPAVARSFAIDSNGAFAQLTIDSSGTVTPTVNASTTALSLEGVSWTVD